MMAVIFCEPVTLYLIEKMSLGGTLHDQQSLTGSLTRTANPKPELNLFQKIDIVSAELEGVASMLERLGDEC
jgi:hypothetical protein